MPANELLEEQRRKAADLIARNWKQKDIATELGCSPKTIQRLCKKPDFQAMVRERRAVAMTRFPEVEAVLKEALAARTDDEEDWKTRLKAAELLIKVYDPLAKLPDPEDEEPETEFFDEEDDDAGAD